MLHDGNIALKYFELKIFHGGNKINSSFIHAFTQEIAIECLSSTSWQACGTLYSSGTWRPSQSWSSLVASDALKQTEIRHENCDVTKKAVSKLSKQRREVFRKAAADTSLRFMNYSDFFSQISETFK